MNKHNEKVFILKPDGNRVPLIQWQEERGYEIGGARISKHFWFTESKFMQDLQDYGELIVCELLMQVADKYRDLKAAAVHVNSFNRNRDKQKQLLKDGFKAAAFSPHEFCLAIDVDTTTEEETRLNAAMVREAAKQLGIKVRIGFEQYLKQKNTFIHFDVCPEYFAPGAVWHHIKHPKQWEIENQW